jgi:hypothetical protein
VVELLLIPRNASGLVTGVDRSLQFLRRTSESVGVESGCRRRALVFVDAFTNGNGFLAELNDLHDATRDGKRCEAFHDCGAPDDEIVECGLVAELLEEKRL